LASNTNETAVPNTNNNTNTAAVTNDTNQTEVPQDVWHASAAARTEENRGANDIETQTTPTSRCDRSQDVQSGEYFALMETLKEWDP